MKSAGLILQKFGVSSPYENFCYEANPAFLNEALNVKALPIEEKRHHRSEEAWQRRLGRGSKKKDLRAKVDCTLYDLNSPEEALKQEVLASYHRSNLIQQKTILRRLWCEKGLSHQTALSLIDAVLPDAKSDLERH